MSNLKAVPAPAPFIAPVIEVTPDESVTSAPTKKLIPWYEWVPVPPVKTDLGV